MRGKIPFDPHIIKLYKNSVFDTSTPLPSFMRGFRGFFLLQVLHNNLMSNILQDIFKDNYERMIYTLHPRKSVIENVDRMINCGDPSFGGAMYGCGKCGTLKFVPFRCHSRFCPTCGTKYSIDRTTSMSFKIINVQHRHCVFTIDSELRHFFLEDRELLGLLFEAVQSVILRMFHKDNKEGFYIYAKPNKCNPTVVAKYIGRYLGVPLSPLLVLMRTMAKM